VSELSIFDTPHNEAFRILGALEPGQHWSSFDVPRDQARAGEATRFVTTIWNFHWKLEAGHRMPTELAIARDETDETLWYCIPMPPAGTTQKTWLAHWNGLALALTNGIPIVGVLKDFRSNRCSLKHVFDCGSPRGQTDGNAIWLQLKPRGQVGCDVRPINIREVTTQPPSDASPLGQAGRSVEGTNTTSGRRAAARAGWRLASMVAKVALIGMVAVPVMIVGAGSGSQVVFWVGVAMAVMAFLAFAMILLGVSLGALWKLATLR
jgi:hypothetical protein